jgi:hypothetical protein
MPWQYHHGLKMTVRAAKLRGRFTGVGREAMPSSALRCKLTIVRSGETSASVLTHSARPQAMTAICALRPSTQENPISMS